jgi:hypothetical protein
MRLGAAVAQRVGDERVEAVGRSPSMCATAAGATTVRGCGSQRSDDATDHASSRFASVDNWPSTPYTLVTRSQ